MEPIRDALQKLGGPAKVAALLGVTVQAVCFWRDGERRLPADHCPTIERATGGLIRCEDLRPDVDWAYLRSTTKEPA